MGYYADGSGFIVAKDTNAYQKIKEMFGDNSGTNETPYDFWEDEDNLTFNISNGDKYHEDEVFDFFHKISEFINEGEIEYVGEDYEFWHFIFDPDTSSWKEENGRIKYGNPSPSDFCNEDLMQEIEKRGYVVRDL